MEPTSDRLSQSEDERKGGFSLKTKRGDTHICVLGHRV